MSARFAWCSLIITVTLPASVTGHGRRGAPVNLPDGPGKEIVQTACAQCHSLSLIVNDGYSREEWPRIFGTMIELPNEQKNIVADYLAAHFPEKAKPPAVLIASCLTKQRARAASRSTMTMSSGTPTTRAATSAASIPKPARRANGRHRAARSLSRTRSPSLAARSGTSNRRSSRTRSYGSIRRRRNSRPGRYRAAAASCAT